MTILEPMPVATITPPPKASRRKYDPYEDAPDDKLFEVVNGIRVEKTMGVLQLWLGSQIHGLLDQHCRENQLGRSVSEMMFDIPSRSNDRKPDVAFVSYSKWPRNRPVPSVNAWPVVPDFVVEVVSPSDAFFKVIDKVHEYFEAGVKLVWLIVSSVEQAYIFTAQDTVAIVNRDGELDGGDVVPGFRLSMGFLFPVSETEAAP